MTLRRLLPLPLLAALFALASCRSFVPPALADPPAPAEGETVLGTRFLDKKQTIEIEGTFDGDRFLARRIEVEEADDEVTLKGALEALTPGRSAVVGGRELRIIEATRFEDEEGAPLRPEELAPGTWVKAECRPEGDELLLRKLVRRNRKEGEAGELQGTIEEIDRERSELVIGGITVAYAPNTLVVWDVQGAEPPAGDGFQTTLLAAQPSRLRRLLGSTREDDKRPTDQLQVGDVLTVGGEVQYELEWRNNFELRDSVDRDRLLHELSTTLDLTFDLSPQVLAYFQLRARQTAVHWDQDRDLDSDHRGRINEGWILLEDLPLPGAALQVGRVRIDHGREWVVDEQLDAVRIFGDFDRVFLELSVSTVLFDTSPEQEGITNLMGALHVDVDRRNRLFLYALHRKDGTLLDLARTHVGLSGEGRVDWFSWWLDAGYAFGREEDQDIGGFGVDAMVMARFRDLLFEPYVYAGFAFGSGDADPEGGTDGNFRQTGLNDNNDKLGGVASFRYLGELFRPELSNLAVFTAGVGFRPLPETSLDLVYHHYRQEEAAPFLGDTRLRFDPAGEEKDLGHEVDVILGLESFFPLEVELIFSYFQPGPAFDTDDDAWFVNLQIEWNF